MSLRKRLTFLLSLFGLYAVVAAVVAIVGSHMRIDRAADEFQRTVGQTTCVERLELLLTEQTFLLRQLVAGQLEALKPYGQARENWSIALLQCTSFGSTGSNPAWSDFRPTTDEFEATANRLLELIDQHRPDEARSYLDENLDASLVPLMREQLRTIQAVLAAARDDSARSLASTTSKSLSATIGVGALAAALVFAGLVLVHRWLIQPITQLQRTAMQFREGNPEFRNRLNSNDELGQLARTLDEMAEALAASKRKHQTLFANLQDAVIICDHGGRIIEYHDGDTRILGVDGYHHVGRLILDVWPEWQIVANWSELINRAIDEGRRARLHDVRLESTASGKPTIADFIVYRVDCGRAQCAAIVIRDVTQRHNLQERLHHAEIMEALGTMAAGLAHDVNNLLASVNGTLSFLAKDLADTQYSDRITRALKAVCRAAGFTKRLLNFAQGVRGTPQVFAPAEVIVAILDAFDLAVEKSVTLKPQLDAGTRIRMDQDQFAQIVLNLVRNALEATPDGGEIAIELSESLLSHPDRQEDLEAFTVLVVRDSGEGMSREVEERMFEPFFTTKSNSGRQGRGMGLAIVMAAVRNVGGFLRVKTRPGEGTCIQVCLPTASGGASRTQDTHQIAGLT